MLGRCRMTMLHAARRKTHAAVALVAVALFTGLAQAQEVRYVYDAKGQLVGLIDVDGSAGTWTWDENGNLLAMSRTLAGSLPGNVGLTLVSPNQGKPGDPIEIVGKGLANPTSVTFNGVAATVQTSTFSGSYGRGE